jgi:polysaccharide biosynthesis protein PslH
MEVRASAAAARLTILCPEPPFPATHGARVDRWNRIFALREMGVGVQVILWSHSSADESEAARALELVGCEVVCLTRRRRMRDYLFRRYPGRLYSYCPRGNKMAVLYKQVEAFAPKAILSDGLDPCLIGRDLAVRLAVPLALRSHNIEHMYWRFQLGLSTGRELLASLLAVPKLELAEREMRRAAQLILDISEDDRDWWRNHGGAGRSVIVPPIWRPNTSGLLDLRAWDFDVAFTGNLFAPNNVEGLKWFAEQVLPSVRAGSGGPLRVVCAGSRPTRTVWRLCKRSGITCAADPDSLELFSYGSRVLINPVRHSSGVNVKMFEMLATSRPIVSTPEGIRGLPKRLRTFVDVCDTSDEFATAIIRHLQNPRLNDVTSRTALLQRACSPGALEPLVALAS